MTNLFFVYGTLMRGECRGHLMENLGAEPVCLAHTSGRLLHCGGYPGMVVPEHPTHETVKGELVRVHDLKQAFEALDRVEGYVPENPGMSLFQRTTIAAVTPDGGTETAWAYLYAGMNHLYPVIASGDWRASKG